MYEKGEFFRHGYKKINALITSILLIEGLNGGVANTVHG